MNDWDYKNIIIFNYRDNPKYVKNEYYKSFKKEKKNDLSSDEFFGRCKDMINYFKEYYMSNVSSRITELKTELEKAKNKTIKFIDNDSELSYDQRCEKTVNELDSEITLFLNNSDYTKYPFNNIEIKFSLIHGKLNYNDILIIEKAIDEAEKRVIEEEEEEEKLNAINEAKRLDRNKVLSAEIELVSKWTTPLFALFLYFLRVGGYKERITKKHLTELCREFNYTKDINNLNNTIIAIKKCNDKDPYNEVNLSYIITLFVKEYTNFPKSKRLVIEALSDYQPKPMR